MQLYGGGDKTSLYKLILQLNITDSFQINEATTDILKKYTESSICILSSRFEGFGMSIAEAMSCGIPVVSFNCPCGPRYIIRDGEDGILVENGNVEQLADKICYLIENIAINGANSEAKKSFYCTKIYCCRNDCWSSKKLEEIKDEANICCGSNTR